MQADQYRTTPEQRRALDLLRGAESVLLSGHVRPDGDCIGAQAALARVLEALGKRVAILNPDPPEERFGYLSSAVRFGVHEGGPLPEHDLAVLLDISELHRCGELEEPLRAAPSRKLVVDHHIHHGEAWWDAAFVDVSASATGLLVLRIARELGVALDPVAARGVFTSLVTDTGWFKYSNTDAETLAAASALVEAGVEPSELYRAIYQSQDPVQPRTLGRVLERVRFFEDARLAVVDLPLELPAGSGGEPVRAGDLGDPETLLDVLRAVGPVEVVLFLRELEGGACKLSARSKGSYDVNALAREFGGGGHAKASGATIEGSLDEVRTRLVEAARSRFRERAG